MLFLKIKIHLMPKINIIIVKNNKNYACILFNDFFFYKLYQKYNLFTPYFEKSTNTLYMFSKNPLLLNKIYEKTIERLCFSFNFYFFAKFKLKGKGFRMFRGSEDKFIEFHLGHSHICLIHFRGVILYKLTKYKFFIFNNSLLKIKKAMKLVHTVKPKNFYTKRGIGYTKQIIMKRKGKGALA